MGIFKTNRKSLFLLLIIAVMFIGCGGGGSSSGGSGGGSSPAPAISASVDKTTLNPGQSAVLTWSTTNATSVSLSETVSSSSVSAQGGKVLFTAVLNERGCTLYGDPEHIHQAETEAEESGKTEQDITAAEALALTGSKTVTPAKTTTYTFTATGSGGSHTQSIMVTVVTIEQQNAWVMEYNVATVHPSQPAATIRWANGYIDVYDTTGYTGLQTVFDEWNAVVGNIVKLRLSTNPNSPVKIIVNSANLPANASAIAWTGQVTYLGDGSPSDWTNALGGIEVHPNYVNFKQIYLHELGHILAFRNHTTNDSGFMNGSGYNSEKFSPLISGMMSRLHQLPPGTKVPLPLY